MIRALHCCIYILAIHLFKSSMYIVLRLQLLIIIVHYSSYIGPWGLWILMMCMYNASISIIIAQLLLLTYPDMKYLAGTCMTQFNKYYILNRVQNFCGLNFAVRWHYYDTHKVSYNGTSMNDFWASHYSIH